MNKLQTLLIWILDTDILQMTLKFSLFTVEPKFHKIKEEQMCKNSN